MNDSDLQFVKRAIAAGLITDSILEFGVGYDGPTCKEVALTAGLRYIGSDIKDGRHVDIAANLESTNDLRQFDDIGPFGAVLLLNILEHTFDPIRVLDNIVKLVRQGGAIVISAPAVWPIHNYPFDAWRLLPHFYEEYAKRRGLQLHTDLFDYIGIGKISETVNYDGTYRFPYPGRSRAHRLYSRIVHKLFNTSGRGMLQPSHVACGCVLRVL